MRRNVSIIKDALGKSIVFIHDIRFQGRQSIDWKAVERYAEVLIRHDNNGRLYLYDIVNIRKETSTPLEQ